MMSRDDKPHLDEAPYFFDRLGVNDATPTGSPATTVKQQSPKRTKKKQAARRAPSDGNVGVAFLSDQDVALRFRVTRQTIWRWVVSGHFPTPVKLSPGTSRWRLDEILAFEHRLPRHSPQKPSKDEGGEH